MSASDPLGYYAVLGVAPNASAAVIKASFRRKAMEYHPDRCKLPNATAIFQHVNHAFGVLADPDPRARYDTSAVEASTTSRPNAPREEAPEPVLCSVCGKVSEQPRYAIFYRVSSFLIITRREAIQGIYCAACAEKKCLKATAFTWALAWWGIPWGLVYGLQAIVVNLFGGKRPPDINARLLSHQAWYFAVTGHADVARAVAEQALGLALKVKNDPEIARLRARLDSFIASFPSGSRAPQLKDQWHLRRRPFFVQTAVLVAALAGLGYSLASSNSPTTFSPTYAQASPTPRPHQAYTPMPPTEPAPQSIVSGNRSERARANVAALPPAYVRPALAPTGKPWPTAAGYIKGLPQKNKNGYSEVTVDNSRNSSDVFVKLVSVSEGPKAFPVRQFFVPAFASFVVKNVRAGRYDVRYQNLDSGGKSGSPPFELTETEVSDGIEYSRYDLTLYTVLNGNMKMRQLSDDESRLVDYRCEFREKELLEAPCISERSSQCLCWSVLQVSRAAPPTPQRTTTLSLNIKRATATPLSLSYCRLLSMDSPRHKTTWASSTTRAALRVSPTTPVRFIGSRRQHRMMCPGRCAISLGISNTVLAQNAMRRWLESGT